MKNMVPKSEGAVLNKRCLTKAKQGINKKENFVRNKGNSAQLLYNIISPICEWMLDNFYRDEE